MVDTAIMLANISCIPNEATPTSRSVFHPGVRKCSSTFLPRMTAPREEVGFGHPGARERARNLPRQAFQRGGEFVAQLGGLGAAFVLGLDDIGRGFGQELLVAEFLVDLGDLAIGLGDLAL